MKTWCHAFYCHIWISRYINLSGHSSSHPPPSLQATTDHVTCCITEPAENHPSPASLWSETPPSLKPSSLPLPLLSLPLLYQPASSSSPQVTAGQQTTTSTFTASHTAYTQSSSKTLAVKKSANSIRQLRHITDSTDFDTQHDMTHRTHLF